MRQRAGKVAVSWLQFTYVIGVFAQSENSCFLRREEDWNG